MHWNEVIFHPGNEELKRFIELGILAAEAGVPVHFHVEGVRGTGKTTLIRAAKSCLPPIQRVSGCLYNCEPGQPHCPQHRAAGELSAETAPMPFLEISHSAKVGTVVGSIDLDRLTAAQQPEAALLPGTLPRAHRGIVFVDEINRLADTSPALVDVLLDVMGTKPGRVQIEETGLQTVEMPVSVSVWAASNPDEEPGPLQEIRRQLSDRFDFVIRIERPETPDTVKAIVNTANSTLPAHEFLFSRTVSSDFSSVGVEEKVDEFLSQLYIRYRLESIRGIQAARLGARLHAALMGRKSAGFADLSAVLPAALRHRMDKPKLIEIAEAMRLATAEKRREEKTAQANIRGEADNRPKARYPALWKGLWQRLAKGQSSNKGKPLHTERQGHQPATSTDAGKKKPEPVLKSREETGIQVK